MNTGNAPAIVSRLEVVQETNDGWECRCPAHEDRHASLSVGIGDDGRTLVCCHAGCSAEAIVSAAGMRMKDLMPGSNGTAHSAGKPRIVKTYNYGDEEGTLLYQVVRFDPKDFRQRQPKPGGGWNWSLKGVKKVLYRLPELMAPDNAAKTVFVVEGEKDADNLARLDVLATTSAGGAGKWNKSYSTAMKGRNVVLLPDCDEPGRKHAETVARSLHGVAASVRVLTLPGLPDKGDVSDWLAAGGTRDELLRLAKEVSEWEPSAEQTDQESDSEPGNVKMLADMICRDNHFAQDAGGKLYRYADGKYRFKAEEYVKAQVKRWCIKLEMTDKWSSRLAAEVVEFIRVDLPRLWERPPLDVLNVENGLLRIRDRKLLPHSPNHLSTVQLPVAYSPNATCPATEKFVGEVFPADARDLAWEVPAWLMLPDTAIQKAILLIGEGANGKSTWLTQVIKFLGKGNTSGVSLHKLESDKFATARLLGRLANVCPDLPSEHLAGTSTFKALTGGDTLQAEYKYRDSFDFDPFARLVFSANHPPRSADASHAFFRRWLVIPFDRTFAGDDLVPRDVLDARLAKPSELSGLLNKALHALSRLKEQRGFSEPESCRLAWAEFHATTDPLAVWLDQHTIDDPSTYVTGKSLRTTYNAAADRAMTDTAFGNAFRKLRPGAQRIQRVVNGRRQWCYLGIGMRSETPDSAPGAPGSPGSPICLHAGKKDEGKGGGEGSRLLNNRWDNPVNLVHPVHDEAPDNSQCQHPRDSQIRRQVDGKMRVECGVCGQFYGYQ